MQNLWEAVNNDLGDAREAFENLPNDASQEGKDAAKAKIAEIEAIRQSIIDEEA